MAYIKGLLVKVSIGNNVIGGQRGATLNREMGTSDTTNKDGDGWSENSSTVKSWSIDCDGLIIKDEEAYKSVKAAFIAGEAVEVKFGDSTCGIGEKGKAIITSFPIEAPYDSEATYSISLTGTGPLEEITA